MKRRAVQSAALPQDSQGFVRRECPSCHRHFKTRPSPGDGLSVLQRLGLVLPHENPHEIDGGRARRCLYCGRSAPADGWLTAEQRDHLARVAAAWAAEVRSEQARSLHPPGARRPAPSSSDRRVSMPPEPDDLEPVPLLCCGEEAKALKDWRGSVYCPRCGARQSTGRVALGMPPARE